LGFNFVKPIEQPLLSLKEFFDDTENRILKKAGAVREGFFSLLSEIDNPDEITELLLESYISQIVAGTFRLFNQKGFERYRYGDERSADEKLVRDIIYYIDSNIESLEKLSILSDIFGYSYTHIAKKFSEVTGENLKSHFTKRRFQKAKEYLRCTDKRSGEIALEVGYKDSHYFSFLFKKTQGYTPSEYRNQGGKLIEKIAK
jgi:two-component system response regulator YesN